MRMICIDFEGLDLFVRFDRDDEAPDGIYAFTGRDRNGKDKYNLLKDVFRFSVEETIYEAASEKLKDTLQDEADEARYIAETCYDTPYRRAA